MYIYIYIYVNIYLCIYIYIYIYSIRFAKPGGPTNKFHAWRIQTLFIKSKRTGTHPTFYNFGVTWRSSEVHFLIILGSKWGLETTPGPKWSQRASQTEKREIPDPWAQESLPPIFMFFRIGVEILMFLFIYYSSVVFLRFPIDSWTSGMSKIMLKQCRVSQNQGFAYLRKVCFQTPVGVHFDVILEGLGHQSFTFSGFLGGVLFVPKTLKFGRPTVSRGRSKRPPRQYYFKRSLFYFSIRIEASGWRAECRKLSVGF